MSASLLRGGGSPEGDVGPTKLAIRRKTAKLCTEKCLYFALPYPFFRKTLWCYDYVFVFLHKLFIIYDTDHCFCSAREEGV